MFTGSKRSQSILHNHRLCLLTANPIDRVILHNGTVDSDLDRSSCYFFNPIVNHRERYILRLRRRYISINRRKNIYNRQIILGFFNLFNRNVVDTNQIHIGIAERMEPQIIYPVFLDMYHIRRFGIFVRKERIIFDNQICHGFGSSFGSVINRKPLLISHRSIPEFETIIPGIQSDRFENKPIVARESRTITIYHGIIPRILESSTVNTPITVTLITGIVIQIEIFNGTATILIFKAIEIRDTGWAEMVNDYRSSVIRKIIIFLRRNPCFDGICPRLRQIGQLSKGISIRFSYLNSFIYCFGHNRLLIHLKRDLQIGYRVKAHICHMQFDRFLGQILVRFAGYYRIGTHIIPFGRN